MINPQIPKLTSLGLISSVIGQYISDVIFNIFIFDKENFLEIIQDISPLPLYYAASVSGFITGSITENVDVLVSAVFRNVLYVYTNIFVSNLTDETDELTDIDTQELIVDTVAIVILLYTLDEYTRENFRYFKERRQGIIVGDEEDRGTFSTVLIIFITNFYAYYKLQINNNTVLDRSIDV